MTENPAIIRMLNDREQLVLECILKRFNEREAVAYLKAEGHAISIKTYWRTRGKLQATKRQRLFEIGQSGFEEQHLWRIDTLEAVEKGLWREYHREKDASKRARILVFIAEIQPYLATFYRTTRKVIENEKPTEGTTRIPGLAD